MLTCSIILSANEMIKFYVNMLSFRRHAAECYNRNDCQYGGTPIELSPAIKIHYVNVPFNYVSERLFYVNMQYNYIDMQHNLSHMLKRVGIQHA